MPVDKSISAVVGASPYIFHAPIFSPGEAEAEKEGEEGEERKGEESEREREYPLSRENEEALTAHAPHTVTDKLTSLPETTAGNFVLSGETVRLRAIAPLDIAFYPVISFASLRAPA